MLLCHISYSRVTLMSKDVSYLSMKIQAVWPDTKIYSDVLAVTCFLVTKAQLPHLRIQLRIVLILKLQWNQFSTGR